MTISNNIVFTNKTVIIMKMFNDVQRTPRAPYKALAPPAIKSEYLKAKRKLSLKLRMSYTNMSECIDDGAGVERNIIRRLDFANIN
jgi:hypothetical protein